MRAQAVAAAEVERLAALVRAARSVVALTGAGISVPSGIPDFRSPDTGLWRHVDPIEVAHIEKVLTNIGLEATASTGEPETFDTY